MHLMWTDLGVSDSANRTMISGVKMICTCYVYFLRDTCHPY